MKAKLVIIFAAAALACSFAWTGYAQRSKTVSTSWEYRAVFDPVSNSFTREASFDKGVSEMNTLGAQGWELVSMNNTEYGTILYFKRSK